MRIVLVSFCLISVFKTTNFFDSVLLILPFAYFSILFRTIFTTNDFAGKITVDADVNIKLRQCPYK